jgi:hypothetical protein
VAHLRLDHYWTIGCPDLYDSHAILGERARLVSADDRRRTERLDRRESLHDCTTARKIAHAERESERDRRKQALWDVRNEQTDGEADGCSEAEPRRGAKRKKCNRANQRDDSDQPGDTLDLSLKWTRFLYGPLREGCDPTELGAHPGSSHNGSRLAPYACRPTEYEIARFEKCSRSTERISRPKDGCGFAIEGRKVNLDVASKQASVRADPVSFLDEEHITGNKRSSFDFDALAITDHPRSLRQIRRECLDSALGLELLSEREKCVQDDDRSDRAREEVASIQERKSRGRRKQQSKWVGELS